MAVLAHQSSSTMDDPASRDLIEFHSDSLTNRNRRNIFREISKSFPKLGLTRNNEDLKRLLNIFKTNEDIEPYLNDIMIESLNISSTEFKAPLNINIKRIKQDFTEETINVKITKDLESGTEKDLMEGIYYEDGMPYNIILLIHKNNIAGKEVSKNEIFKEIFINSVLSLFESKYLRKIKEVPEGVANLVMNTYFKIDGELRLVTLINKFDGDLYDYLKLQKDNCTCSLEKLVKDVLYQVSCAYELLHNVFYFQHNDLHLGNIFYKNKGNQNISYLLGDFGMSSIRIFVDEELLPGHKSSESIFIAKENRLNTELIKEQLKFNYSIDYDFYKLALFINNKLEENKLHVNELLFNNVTHSILKKISRTNRKIYPNTYKNYPNKNLVNLFKEMGMIKELYFDLKNLNINFIKNIKDYLKRTSYKFNCSHLHRHLYTYIHERIPLEFEYDGVDERGEIEERAISVDSDKKYYSKYIKYKMKYIKLKRDF